MFLPYPHVSSYKHVQVPAYKRVCRLGPPQQHRLTQTCVAARMQSSLTRHQQYGLALLHRTPRTSERSQGASHVLSVCCCCCCRLTLPPPQTKVITDSTLGATAALQKDAAVASHMPDTGLLSPRPPSPTKPTLSTHTECQAAQAQKLYSRRRNTADCWHASIAEHMPRTQGASCAPPHVSTHTVAAPATPRPRITALHYTPTLPPTRKTGCCTT